MAARGLSLNSKIILCYLLSVWYASGNEVFAIKYRNIEQAFNITLNGYINALNKLRKKDYIGLCDGKEDTYSFEVRLAEKTFKEFKILDRKEK